MWTIESAAQALEAASVYEWDALLGDAAFLVHVDPDLLRRVVPVTYQPVSEPARHTLKVYRTVAHRLVGVDPAGRAQVLSVQAVRFRVEDCFSSAVEPGMWSCEWASGGSTPHGLLAQLPQSSGEAAAVGRVDGCHLAVTSDYDDAALRVWDLSYGTQIGQPLFGHEPVQEGGVRSLALLTGVEVSIVVSAGFDDTVRCWDLLRGERIGDALDSGRDGVWAMASTLVGGAPVVLVGGDDALHLWGSPGHWERLGPALPHSGQVRAVATAQVNGVPVALTGCADGTLRAWDLARYEVIGTPLQGHVGSIDAITIVELAGRTVALTACADRMLRVWDLHDRSAIGYVPLEGASRVNALAALPSNFGWEVLIGSAPAGRPGGTVSRFILPHSYRASDRGIAATPTLIRATGIAVANVNGCRMAIAVGGPDETVQLWDLDAATPPESAGHRDEVNAIVATRMANVPVLLTGGEDGTVQAWDRSTGTPAAQPLVTGADQAVDDLTVVDLGGRSLLVTCHRQEEIRVWDLATGHLLTEFDTDCQWVRGVDTVHIDNQPIIVSTGGYRTQLWDVASAQELDTQFDKGTAYFKAVGTTRIKGRPVAVTTAPAGQVKVWDCAGGEPFSLVGHSLDVNAVAAGEFAGMPLALTSASYGTTGDVCLWNLDTRQCLIQFEAGHSVRALALTQIGTRLTAFTGGEDSTIYAWDCSLGQPLATLHLPDTVTALTWDKDQLAVCFGNEIAVFTLQK
ncbi:WD40 repeat domain-containing protein [Streptomyces sp. NPDC086783]|uniref:WD40 repeat domain-containing protein n=1 Tax=Streptomyces sp. NPDC086783 TaxID=3365758 RepID=UPI0038184181